MARFLMVLSPEHPTHGELSAGALGRRADLFARWVDGMRHDGVLRGATRLQPAGVRISRPGSEKGAWERSEAAAVSGCLLIEADSLEAAVVIAGDCPAVAPGCIDILELDIGTEFGSFQDCVG